MDYALRGMCKTNLQVPTFLVDFALRDGMPGHRLAIRPLAVNFVFDSATIVELSKAEEIHKLDHNDDSEIWKCRR